LKRVAFVVALGGSTVFGAALGAQTISTSDAIARLFTAPKLEPSWFSPIILAQVPVEQLQTVVKQIVATLGSFQSVAVNGNGFTVRFASGSVQATATLNADGVFTNLLFSRMQSDAAANRVASLFQTHSVPATWFSDRFLSSVPIERVRAINDAVITQYGAYQTTTPAKDGTYTVTFAKGAMSCNIFLGPDGKIEGLLLRPTAG
jgi:hypothetical protein